MKVTATAKKVTAISKPKTLSHEQRSIIATAAAKRAWKTMNSAAYKKAHAKRRAA